MTGEGENTIGNLRTNISFKDLGMAFLMNGIEGVQKIVELSNVPKATHLKAIAFLKENNKEVSDYETFLNASFNASEPPERLHRGRSAPKPGESRIYKTQKIGVGGIFVKIPLEAIGCERGDKVKVDFEGDKISVVRYDGADEPEDASIEPRTRLIILGNDGDSDVQISAEEDEEEPSELPNEE